MKNTSNNVIIFAYKVDTLYEKISHACFYYFFITCFL